MITLRATEWRKDSLLACAVLEGLRLGMSPRKLFAIRLDPRILEWVRKTAARKKLPYQSLINDVLAREMKKAQGASSLTKLFEQDIDRSAHLE